MPPRLSKRQQRETEELETLSKSLGNEVHDSDEESPSKRGGGSSGAMGFASLLDNTEQGDKDESQSEEEQMIKTPKSKKAKKKKKKSSGAPTHISEVPDQRSSQSVSSKPSSKSKGKPQGSGTSKSKAKDDEEFEKALAELSGKYATARLSDSKGKALVSNYDALYSLLSVSMKNLDPEAELRRFFGSKVIASSRPAASSKSSHVKSHFARPQSNWPPAQYRAGLSIRVLEADELNGKNTVGDSRERWWTVEASPRYKVATYEYLECVMGGDPHSFFKLMAEMPWHADTLLQLAAVFRHREEYSSAADYMARALFAYERAFTGAFNLATGYHRLDFDFVENRVFYLAVARNIVDLNRRGTPRTAFEYARLLFALDPYTDPHGALLHLDFLAIKAKQIDWLLNVWDTYSGMNSGMNSGGKSGETSIDPTFLPGWAWSRALAFFEREGELDSEHLKSTEALKEAISTWPALASLLADKLDITLPPELRNHEAFRIVIDYDDNRDDTATSVRNLLCHIYVTRSISLWKVPSRSGWLSKTLVSLSPTFSSSKSPPHAVERLALFHSQSYLSDAVYRHILVVSPLVTEFGRLTAFFPQAIKSRLEAIEGDPLPPVTAITQYDDDYFLNVVKNSDNMTRAGVGSAATRLRRLLRTPDQAQQLMDLHPRLAEIFPGGAAQLVMRAQEAPHQVLDMIIFLDAVNGLNILPEGREANGAPEEGGRMPGGHEVFGEPNEQPVQRDQDEALDSDEEEVEEDDAQPPLALRILQNVFGRLWGPAAADQDQDTSDDDSADVQGNAAPHDVD